MAGSVNKVIVVGNLGRDPEVRFANNGAKIVNMSVATSESWKDKESGEWRDKTEWHKVVIFNDRLADVAERFLRKGSKVYLEGQLQTRKWTDQAGVERYSTEVVLQRYRGELTMLDNKQDDQGGYCQSPNGADSQAYGNQGRSQQQSSGPEWNQGGGQYDTSRDDLDDEIPF